MGVLSPSDWTNAFSSDPTGAKSAATTAADTQMAMFNKTQQNEAPFMASGTTANNMLMSQLPSLTAPYSLSKYQESPEYQNSMTAMTNMLAQLKGGASAGGSLGTGNMDTALQGNANQLAMQGYTQGLQDYQGQNLNSFNMLNSVSGSGQNAAASLGGFGANVANQIGTNGMNAASSNFLGKTGLTNISNNLGTGLGNYLTAPSGYGGTNAGYLGTQIFGNAGTPGTLYNTNSLDLSNASMSDSQGWFSSLFGG